MHADKTASPFMTVNSSSTAGASAPAVCGPPFGELLKLQGGALLFGDTGEGSHDLLPTQLATTLGGFLESGYLVGEDTGPVQRLVSTAWQAEGVQEGAVNLALHPDARVFGFLDCQGVGDCYYAYRGSQYYTICIESGTITGGPYDIFVSPAMTWAQLRQELEFQRRML